MINLLDDEPRRFGDALGARLWGGTLYELGPGESSPYHWHYGEEEVLVCLAGRLTLRAPEGERVLGPWDAAWFVRGPQGTHQLRNDTNEPGRAVVFSTCSDPEVCVYPDDGKVGVFAGWSRDDLPTQRGYVEPS